MNSTQNHIKLAREYREKAAQLAEMREEIGEKGGSVPLEDLQRSFNELTLRTKEFNDLRNALGPYGIFLIKYGVEVVNSHTVSFVVPKGVSRMDILEEALQVSGCDQFIQRFRMQGWKGYSEFNSRAEHSEFVCIDGCVQGLAGESLERQKQLLVEKGFDPVTMEDLIVACATFYIATGEPVFGWFDRSSQQSFYVRWGTGALVFEDGEFKSCAITKEAGMRDVTMAGRIPISPRTKS